MNQTIQTVVSYNVQNLGIGVFVKQWNLTQMVEVISWTDIYGRDQGPTIFYTFSWAEIPFQGINRVHIGWRWATHGILSLPNLLWNPVWYYLLMYVLKWCYFLSFFNDIVSQHVETQLVLSDGVRMTLNNFGLSLKTYGLGPQWSSTFLASGTGCMGIIFPGTGPGGGRREELSSVSGNPKESFST